MVKKTIIAIVAIVLLAVVFVGANHRLYMSRFGSYYATGYPYANYPMFNYPYSGAYYPTYSPYAYYTYPGYPYYYYNYPVSSSPYYVRPSYASPYYYPSYNYPSYNYPAYAYPYDASSPAGQLCGTVDGRQYGCDYGLVCDYTKTEANGIGVCTIQG